MERRLTDYVRTLINGEAYITVSRNRAKNYNGQVYLQDGQEFEIELYNPTPKTKLAKIWINGTLTSQSGLVLKPGQRVYLERFIDTPSKFKFETYTIDGTAQSLAAIMNNGDVKICFYDEEELTPLQYTVTSTPTYKWDTYNLGTEKYRDDKYKHSLAEKFKNDNLTGSSGLQGFTGNRGLTGVSGAYDSSKTIQTCFFNSPSFNEDPIETGRVEKGNHSNQIFENYHGSFRTFASNTVFIKLLPNSAKPIEAKDLAVYCTTCGTKNKKNTWKFCPKCGQKF